MLIEFRPGDRMTATYALVLLDKALTDVRQKLEMLTIDSTIVQKEQGCCEMAMSTLEETGTEVELTHIEAQSLRLALRLYYAKLAELLKAEAKLLIEVTTTEGRMAAIDDLIIRLGGQTTLKLEVTVT